VALAGTAAIAALNDGYRLASGAGALCAFAAAMLGAFLIPRRPSVASAESAAPAAT
jgi:hypothetical protein